MYVLNYIAIHQYIERLKIFSIVETIFYQFHMRYLVNINV